jgi:large subunit ribosomal protein L15
MKLHDLGPNPGARRPKKRLARGNAGQGGTYAGRGRKGQNARSGGAKGPYFEGGQLPFVRRIPFRRGFKNIFRVTYTPVNLAVLDALFEAGDTVSPAELAAHGVLRNAGEPFKVLGHGGLTKALTVRAPRFSEAARTAIAAVGGSVEELEATFRRPGMGRSHRR